MLVPAPVQEHIAVAPLPHAGNDVYKNAFPPWLPPKGVRGIVGSFLLAQSISAAQKTLSPAFAVHSSQSVFLRPGNARDDIVYHVERITDGRAFAMRQVRVVQAKVDIFIATIGFQKNGNSLRNSTSVLQYDAALPDLRGLGPEDLVGSRNTRKNMLITMGYATLMPGDDGPVDPFEWRALPSEKTDDPTRFRLLSFGRSPRFSTDDPSEHLAALAFLSDEFCMGFSSLANPKAVGEKSMNVAVQATISHSIVFHSSVARVDEWLVLERVTTWAAEGRVLVQQRFWSYDTGRLLLTCISEGLVHLRRAKL